MLTHDVRTMRDYAYARVAAGQPMPGVCVVKRLTPIGDAIADILLLVGASYAGEWAGRIWYVPLR